MEDGMLNESVAKKHIAMAEGQAPRIVAEGLAGGGTKYRMKTDTRVSNE
jgi:hypothetical protein